MCAVWNCFATHNTYWRARSTYIICASFQIHFFKSITNDLEKEYFNFFLSDNVNWLLRVICVTSIFKKLLSIKIETLQFSIGVNVA